MKRDEKCINTEKNRESKINYVVEETTLDGL